MARLIEIDKVIATLASKKYPNFKAFEQIALDEFSAIASKGNLTHELEARYKRAEDRYIRHGLDGNKRSVGRGGYALWEMVLIETTSKLSPTKPTSQAVGKTKRLIKALMKEGKSATDIKDQFHKIIDGWDYVSGAEFSVSADRYISVPDKPCVEFYADYKLQLEALFDQKAP